MSVSLTPRQAEAKVFIADYLAAHGHAPTYSEIADALNLRSKSGVVQLIEALEARGHLRRLPHKTRALEILGAGEALLDLSGLPTADLMALYRRIDAELSRRSA